MRARHHDLGRPLPRGRRAIDGVAVRRFPVTRRHARPTSTPCTDLVVRRGRRVTDAEQARLARQAGPDLARVDRRRSRTPTPTSSRSTRSCITRPSRALPHVARARRAASGRARRADVAAAAVPRRVRRRRRPRVLERRRAAASSRTDSRSRRSPPSSSASASTPGTGDADAAPRAARPRRPARICSASAASTTARARACSPSASSGTSAAGPDHCGSCSRARSCNPPPAHPDIVVAGAVDEADEVGPVAGRARTRVAERVRVVLDRAHGSVDRRHAGARQPPVRGHRSTMRHAPAAGSRSAATPSSKSSSTDLAASPALRRAARRGGPGVRRPPLPLARRHRPLRGVPRADRDPRQAAVPPARVTTGRRDAERGHEVVEPREHFLHEREHQRVVARFVGHRDHEVDHRFGTGRRAGGRKNVRMPSRSTVRPGCVEPVVRRAHRMIVERARVPRAARVPQRRSAASSSCRVAATRRLTDEARLVRGLVHEVRAAGERGRRTRGLVDARAARRA